MYEVDIEIGGSPEGYWVMMRFEDQKGKLHRKEFRKERKADKNSNVLQAALEADGRHGANSVLGQTTGPPRSCVNRETGDPNCRTPV